MELSRVPLSIGLALLAAFLGAQRPVQAQSGREGEYALLLSEPALYTPAKQALREAAAGRLARIEAAQVAVRQRVSAAGIPVTGEAHRLVNAVFVRATSEQAQALRSLPGVLRVTFVPRMKARLDRAVDLVKARDAWTVVGGAQNAGAGVKIGVLDSGIDIGHPAFQGDCGATSLPNQPPEWKDFTNRKIIVARSYVSQLANPDGDPRNTRPDDLSPRDHSGHGTAIAMVAAGGAVAGPAATIQGMASKACLGNYKIFGSPGLNDYTYGSVLINALEDAIADGMDIVSISLGNPAQFAPLETDAQDCAGASPGLNIPENACDIRAYALNNTVAQNVTVVVAAGNDGNLGVYAPTANTIATPGTAPAAITVGASTNSHVFFAGVLVDSRRMNALFGDGPKPEAGKPLTAPLRDVSQLQDSGQACSALSGGSLTGAFGLIQRGGCDFATKTNNAQKAGAVGVLIYQVEGYDYPFSPTGLSNTGIPTAMIGYRDGASLKDFLRSSPDKPVTMDSALQPTDAEYDTLADFSSRGPAIRDYNIKPELVAVGTDLYTATQKYDPNATIYDATGFTAVSGTSFTAPMVAGAAAMVKQQSPGFTPGQVKSALVNTASSGIRDVDSSPAGVRAVGAGKLNAAAALAAPASVEPAVLSFGEIKTASLPISATLRVTNTGASNAAFDLSVVPTTTDPLVTMRFSTRQLQLQAGERADVVVTLEGRQPSPGVYEGYIAVGNRLRVPYLYVTGDGRPANAFAIYGDGFTGFVSETDRWIGLRVVDQYGLSVQGAPIRFRSVTGGGQILAADANTVIDGEAWARVQLGAQQGEQQFTAEVTSVTGLTVPFYWTARQAPVINTNGVVNAASFQIGPGLAPGSYITITGSDLSDTTRVFSTPYLPMALAGVSVSFDVPKAGLSLPGRLHFVSEQQVNVQIPWELQGQNSAQMKVSIGDLSTALYTVPLSDYSPAIFEFDDASGRRLAAVLDSGYAVVTAANPARRNAVISIFANGLGPVDNRPASGEPSPAQPLATTRATPAVTIGGKNAQVGWSGLAPGIVGLYQINVTVPPDAPSGFQPIVVSANGINSKPATLPVE